MAIELILLALGVRELVGKSLGDGEGVGDGVKDARIVFHSGISPFVVFSLLLCFIKQNNFRVLIAIGVLVGNLLCGDSFLVFREGRKEPLLRQGIHSSLGFRNLDDAVQSSQVFLGVCLRRDVFTHTLDSEVAIGLLVGIANNHDFVIGVLAHSGAKLLVFRASNLTGFLVEGLGEGQGVVGEVDGDVGFSHSFSRFLAVGRDPFFCFRSEVCCFCFPHF